MADVSVRPARAGDVPEIARIQVETWRFGYASVVPSAVLDAVTLDAALAAWEAAVQTPPGQHHRVLVALEQDRVVGFAAVAPADDMRPEDPDPESTLSVGPLLVEPRWGRRGHGSRLMAAAIDHALTAGMTRAITWIPEGDTVTREFLVGAGWAADGLARVLDTGAGDLREVRLHVSLERA